jgi:glycosyltransferase involved in cell wall biosynthesis
VYEKYNRDNYYVSISNSDRHARLTYLDTVYNGIDETQFELGTGNGNYLLYFGRIHPQKGAHEAIRIAQSSNRNLILCGLIQDENYYKEKILPYLNDSTIRYLGNIGPSQRRSIMGEAIALLHPISFEEPFGLSVAEAMMCGTPVIAYDRGSMRELVIHEKTGFVVSDMAEAVLAVENLSNINRTACRRHAIENFTANVMAARYLELYKMILKETRRSAVTLY